MARYDAGWGRFPGGSRYDDLLRSYGPPAGRWGEGFRPESRGYDAGFGGGERGWREPWGDVGVGGLAEREEIWDPGTIYGPARYGLGPYHERLRRRHRSDDELKSEVEEALFYDTWVDADAITVEVDEGIVTLRGTLPDYDEIRYATDDAWDVDGVRGVRSDLGVRAAGSQDTGAEDRQGDTERGGTSATRRRKGGGTAASRAGAASGSTGETPAKRTRKKKSSAS